MLGRQVELENAFYVAEYCSPRRLLERKWAIGDDKSVVGIGELPTQPFLREPHALLDCSERSIRVAIQSCHGLINKPM